MCCYSDRIGKVARALSSIANAEAWRKRIKRDPFPNDYASRALTDACRHAAEAVHGLPVAPEVAALIIAALDLLGLAIDDEAEEKGNR